MGLWLWWYEHYSPTFWHVVISRVLDMTPNSCKHSIYQIIFITTCQVQETSSLQLYIKYSPIIKISIYTCVSRDNGNSNKTRQLKLPIWRGFTRWVCLQWKHSMHYKIYLSFSHNTYQPFSNQIFSLKNTLLSLSGNIACITMNLLQCPRTRYTYLSLTIRTNHSLTGYFLLKIPCWVCLET